MAPSDNGLRVTREVELPGSLLADLVTMEQLAFGSGGMNEWFLPAFARHGAVFVLWRGDEPVGLAQCMREWEELESAYLFGFSLVGEARGKGWGRAFLAEICSQLAAMGIRNLSLTVAPHNNAAVRLYENSGFATVAQISDAYGPGNHRYYMTKSLAVRDNNE